MQYASMQMAPAPFPVDGSGSEHFSNTRMYAAIALVPLALNVALGFSLMLYPVFLVIFGVPAFMAVHILQSIAGKTTRPQKGLPGKDLQTYLDVKHASLKQYADRNKIPIEIFFEAYFDQKIDIKGDMLDILEARYDWACFRFTLSQVLCY